MSMTNLRLNRMLMLTGATLMVAGGGIS